MEDWLSVTARARPDGVALLADGRTWTYRDLNAQTMRVCARLTALSVRRGDHVAVLVPNRAGYVFLIHAVARLGAVLVPLNTRLTAAELAFQVARVRCGYLVYSAETADKIAGLDTRLIAIEDLSGSTSDDAAFAEGTIELDAVQAVVFTSGTT